MSRAQGDHDLHRTMALLSQLGFMVLACIMAGFGLGLYIDDWLDTFPVFLILLLIAGIAGGFWRAYVMIMRTLR